MRDDVIKELQNIEDLGVIEPTPEPTGWISRMVHTKKKDGSIRLCIHQVYLNKALLHN